MLYLYVCILCMYICICMFISVCAYDVCMCVFVYAHKHTKHIYSQTCTYVCTHTAYMYIYAKTTHTYKHHTIIYRQNIQTYTDNTQMQYASYTYIHVNMHIYTHKTCVHIYIPYIHK